MIPDIASIANPKPCFEKLLPKSNIRPNMLFITALKQNQLKMKVLKFGLRSKCCFLQTCYVKFHISALRSILIIQRYSHICHNIYVN